MSNDEPVPFETVYRAERRWAQQALVALLAAGVTAEILDEQTPEASQRISFMHQLRVGVPVDELARAQEVLTQWGDESERRAGTLGSRVGAGLVAVFGPPGVVSIVLVVLGRPFPDWLLPASVVWALAAAAVVGVMQHRALAEPEKR